MDLAPLFSRIFGDASGLHTLFAPGRINLIGEHTDYNGGFVLPCTIDRGIWGAVRQRRDSLLRVAAEAYTGLGVREYDLTALPQTLPQDWSKYLLGMVKVAADAGYHLPFGFDLLVRGNLPIANGLSSSHALMVLCGLVMAELYDLPYKDDSGRKELALATQRCENRYIGVQSGIMDGFVIALGSRDQALLLQCSTLEYRRIEMRLPEVELWVLDSGVSRELSVSAYNQRCAECAEALRQIQRAGGEFNYLAELDAEDWRRWQGSIDDPLLRKRAQHVISENLRALEAAETLQHGDMKRFGALLNASHISLRDDYQVTGEALDTLAELCWQEESCLGARMTGAGFGGCFIALFAQGKAEEALQRVAAGYKERLGLELNMFTYRGGETRFK